MRCKVFFQLALVALPLALHVDAASCSAWQTKALDTVKCSGAVGGCASKCCLPDTKKCGHATGTCDANHHKVKAKWGNTAGTAFSTNCCAADKKCSEIYKDNAACGTGYQVNTGNANTKCTSLEDSDCKTGGAQCCSMKSTVCAVGMDSYHITKCGTDSYHITAKLLTDGSDKATCCADKIKCKDVTCSAAKGMKDHASKATNLCSASTTATSTLTLCGEDTNCCMIDDKKCSSFTGCGTDHYLTNLNTDKGTGDTAAQKKVCCVAVATCKDYWAHNPTTTATSGAVQGIPAVAAVAAIIAATATSM